MFDSVIITNCKFFCIDVVEETFYTSNSNSKVFIRDPNM